MFPAGASWPRPGSEREPRHDNPLIAAKHVKSFKLDITNGPPAFLEVASESPKALELDDKTLAIYSRVVNEAHSLFGTAHYPAYHFLVTPVSVTSLLLPQRCDWRDTQVGAKLT